MAKIDLYNDLCFLEALRVEGAGKTCWELQLAKAFELWHEVEIECCRMPGYNYAEVEDNAAVDEEELNVDQSVDVEYSMDEGMYQVWRGQHINSNFDRHSIDRHGRRNDG